MRQEASIFKAELIAIMAAAKFLNENLEQDMKCIKIFSDAQAALLALNKNTILSNTIVNTHIELVKLREKVQALSLVWIKAHHGHDGNALADEYAKQGTVDPSNYEFSLMTKTEINRIIEKKTLDSWGNKWQNLQQCRQTKNFYPIPSIILHKLVNQLSRSDLSLFIQIITGQNSLNYTTSKINPNHTDQCRYCEEDEETFIHILNECPVFHELRQELLHGAVIENTCDWKPKQLLQFAKEPQIMEALLENTGAY